MHSIIPILSIIVISHEQHKQLRRCIDSILAMPISYPYEIIVSDDRSTDGSYELSQQYASQQQTDKNLLGIIALQCNSDECNPAYNSERSGYNRCNAYPYAQGKYIAFVDADDYFEEGSHVYDLQIEALEKHPECALAMSNHYYMHDGKNDAEIVKPNMELHNGEIVSATDFITKCYFHLNQAFIQRRNLNVNPCEIYGKKWVDSVITYHHLQFGPIVYVDTCGYVYVQYESYVTGVMETQNRDEVIKEGKRIFGDIFEPITTFMGRYEYIPFINAIDVFVMYHNRQQACGNIMTAVTLGKPVLMKNCSPICQMIHDQGCSSVYDVADVSFANIEDIIQSCS